MSVDNFDPVLAAHDERLRTQRDAKKIHEKGRETKWRLTQFHKNCINREALKRSTLKGASTKTDKSKITLPSVMIRED